MKNWKNIEIGLCNIKDGCEHCIYNKDGICIDDDNFILQ